MRKGIEGCVVSVLVMGCSNGIGGDVPRHGETETHGSSSSETTASETGDQGGCVLTQGYWKNHNASSEHPHNQIAWPIAEDTALCDSTWLEILWTPPKGGNAWLILAHQWIAARLNVAAGASASAEVGAAIDEAGGMLEGCTIADGDRAHALELADMLDAYNNGSMGTDHCGDEDDDDDEGDDEGDDDDGHDDACDDDDGEGGGTTGDDDGGTTGDGDDGCHACTTSGDDDGGSSSTTTTTTTTGTSTGGTSMSSSGG
jgi:hypothetical protein